MKPRLLIILNRLVLGGHATDTIPLADCLSDTYDIRIVYGEKEEDEHEFTEAIVRYPGIAFIKIPALKRSVNVLNDALAIKALYKTIKEFRPDIVHTHGAKPGVTGRIAARLARVPTVIHTFHGHLFHSYYGRTVSSVIIQLERLLSRYTTKIIVLSEGQKKEICSIYKIAAPDKVEVIPLGIVEADYIKDASLLRTAFRKQYQLGDNDVAIGNIGRIVPVKNQLFFIDVIQSVLKSGLGSRLKFFFVGDGYLKRALQTRLNDKNISWAEEDRNPSATVVFTSWVTPITLILHGLDIVVLTSLNEGTPLSLIEGQLCGKPVIATDSGGVSDTFVNDESGFLVQNQDKLDFVTKLLLLIQDRDLRARMGSKGSIFIRKQFPKQAEVNAIKKLYADCIRSAKTI